MAKARLRASVSSSVMGTITEATWGCWHVALHERALWCLWRGEHSEGWGLRKSRYWRPGGNRHTWVRGSEALDAPIVDKSKPVYLAHALLPSAAGGRCGVTVRPRAGSTGPCPHTVPWASSRLLTQLLLEDKETSKSPATSRGHSMKVSTAFRKIYPQP